MMCYGDGTHLKSQLITKEIQTKVLLYDALCIDADAIQLCGSNTDKTRLGLQCRTPLRSYPLSLIPTPWSLSPSNVHFTNFWWGLFLSLFLSLMSLLFQEKVKLTFSPRPKTGVWQQHQQKTPKFTTNSTTKKINKSQL